MGAFVITVDLKTTNFKSTTATGKNFVVWQSDVNYFFWLVSLFGRVSSVFITI